MQILQQMEQRLKLTWQKAHLTSNQNEKSKLISEYWTLYRSYKIQKAIVQG